MTEPQRLKQNTILFLQAMCVWLFLLMLPASAATQLPFYVSVKFGADKAVEFSVDLTRNRYYQVELMFPFENQEQRVAARKLVGEPTRICKELKDCGVAPSFLITVRQGTHVLLREERTPGGTNGFSANAFYREILKTSLKPGQYDIRVEVTYLPAELIDYNAMIQFTTDPRSSDLEN